VFETGVRAIARSNACMSAELPVGVIIVSVLFSLITVLSFLSVVPINYVCYT
jgi:hypothetical protein